LKLALHPKRGSFRKSYRIALLVFSLCALSCAGGLGINLFSDADDVKLGTELDQEIRTHPEQYPLLEGRPEVKDYVEEITHKVLSSPDVKKKGIYVYQLEIIDDDSTINAAGELLDQVHARHCSLRSINNQRPILHASISCKWTLRSDRAQNARSEALNLIRNRKGRLPHVMVVTGEPTPGRIASLALGTGDIDCIYHFALPELVATVGDLLIKNAIRQLDTMIQGRRLRDISDLPLDLVI